MIFVNFGTGWAGSVNYDDFEKGAQDAIERRGSRQVSFEFYVTDNENGNMSDFYLKIFPNSEIYAQLVEATKTGEGFPEEVPDDFFIWAWSISF